MRTITATITTAAMLVMGGAAYINASAEDTASTTPPAAGTTPWTMDKVSPPEPVGENQVDVSVVIEPLPEEDVTPSPEPSPTVPVTNACGAGLTLAEDGSCVPLDYWGYVEPSAEVGSSWDGLLVGDVIVCPEGYEVSIDVTPAGTVWAACM